MATNYFHSTDSKLLLLHVVISKYHHSLLCGMGLDPITVSRVTYILLKTLQCSYCRERPHACTSNR